MMGFCWAIGVWGSSVLPVEVLYECFSKALMTSQAAILQLGEGLDNFLPSPLSAALRIARAELEPSHSMMNFLSDGGSSAWWAIFGTVAATRAQRAIGTAVAKIDQRALTAYSRAQFKVGKESIQIAQE